MSDEDVTDGIGAVGVPVVDQARRLRGVLSLAGLVEDIRDHVDSFVEQLVRSAAVLAAGLDGPVAGREAGRPRGTALSS